jgi:hypothetical protein
MDRPTTKIDLKFAKTFMLNPQMGKYVTEPGSQISVKLAFCKIMTKDVGIYKENAT